MSIVKVLILIFVIALVTPLTTTVFDALCWFYSGSTCTGLTYDGTRLMLLFITTMSAMMLMIAMI
jgi:hypothetical protein